MAKDLQLLSFHLLLDVRPESSKGIRGGTGTGRAQYGRGCVHAWARAHVCTCRCCPAVRLRVPGQDDVKAESERLHFDSGCMLQWRLLRTAR